jgi:cysteinyl-tRNA synthetase
MTAATRTLDGLDAFARDFAAARGAPADPAVLDRFRDRMDDDLDAPGAVADLFIAQREARATGNEAIAAAVFELWESGLGLSLDEGSGQIPPEAQAKAAERDEARAARDWSRADRLRNELVADGYVVEDTPEGTRLRR